MQFIKTEIDGLYLIKLTPIHDDRGFFVRSYCKDAFEQAGLCNNLFQSSISFNKKKNTLRGMHYQELPYGEVKIISCSKGKIYDVILDVRPNSKTFKKWTFFELSEDLLQSIYVPEGCAHGFLTLNDNCEVFYQISSRYEPDYARTIRWNDPFFNIQWPVDGDLIMSLKDKNCLNYENKL